MQKHDKYNGIFLPDNGKFVGHLIVAEADSIVKIIGNFFWTNPVSEYIDIHGRLSDGKKASLLNCVWQSRTQYGFGENARFESVFFPNYIVIGEEFVRSDEHAIAAVRYHFKNIAGLLSAHKTFQSLDLDPDEVRRLLEADHKRSVEIAEKHGWSKNPFDPEIGENPRLLYFSGVWEIIAADTKFGRISLTNRTSQGPGSADGIGIDNEVVANLEFAEPHTLSATIRALYTLHSLFELCLGRRQRYQWIEIQLTHSTENGELGFHEEARLYWSLCNKRVEKDKKTSWKCALLTPDRRPEEFTKVVAGWMNSTGVMGEPRDRFATAFFGRYGTNRIVGAANMFDLLPESRVPKKKEPDTLLKSSVEQCRKIFGDLPDSFAKQAVLSALGRVGTASLRDKVYHRADKIIAEVGDKFPELHLPCSHAVLARNHYVHGSPASFDYQGNFTEFAFITDTLEFVFAVSDLLDLGWDLKSWMDNGRSMRHAFGAYIVNFPENMQRLKRLVEG